MFFRHLGCKSERQLGTETAAVNRRTAAQLWSDAFGRLATRGLQLIILIIVIGGAFYGLSQLSTVAIPLVLALIFASTFEPLMLWLRRKNVPSILSTLAVFLLILLLLGGMGFLVVNAVISQWDDLAKQAEDGFAQVLAWVQQLPFAPSQDQIESWRQQALEFLTSSTVSSGAIAGVGAATNFITGLVLTFVILFFFLKDGPAIWDFMTRPFHGEAAARVQRIGDQTVKTLGAYVRGTASVAAVDAAGIGLGLLILQVPLAVPLTALVFFLSFIPIVGAVLAGTLAALVALVSNGFVSALIVVAIVVGVNQLEGNLLQPVLMGRALKLHSLAILLALTIGTVTNGILGAVLAVPIAAVVWGGVKVWHGDNQPANWARPKTRELLQ